MSGWADRVLGASGALAGLAGVAAAAASAHVTGGGSLGTAANFLLFHAPVLLAIPALATVGTVHRGIARVSGAAIGIGLALFSGDLALRALAGSALFPMAAPSGGIALMAGWLGLAAAALTRTRPRSDAPPSFADGRVATARPPRSGA